MVDKNGCRLGDILEYSFNTIYVNKSRWFPVTIIRGILLYGIEGVRVLWALVVDIHYHVGNLSIKLIFIHVYLRNINFVELVIKIIFDPIFPNITLTSNVLLIWYASHGCSDVRITRVLFSISNLVHYQIVTYIMSL